MLLQQPQRPPRVPGRRGRARQRDQPGLDLARQTPGLAKGEGTSARSQTATTKARTSCDTLLVHTRGIACPGAGATSATERESARREHVTGAAVNPGDGGQYPKIP